MPLVAAHRQKADARYSRAVSASALPIHFFTIVVNGEPFIRHHIDVFARLTGPWHWHIVEGVAELHHDSAWSVPRGGRVPHELHDGGRSKDGTSAYLDRLAAAFPDHITLYRQPPGQLWDGKRAMVAAPLPNITDECLLFEVDADELWTVSQIERVRELFAAQPDRTAAWYWCWFFVGPDLVVVDSPARGWTRGPRTEWLRTWRYRPGMRWESHSPPVLSAPRADGTTYDVGLANPFFHDETERAGLRFQHFAYVTPQALAWKETAYGYAGALAQWRALQETSGRVRLRDYFAWVTDDTHVDRAASMGVVPMATPDGGPAADRWQFISDEPLAAPRPRPRSSSAAPLVVIDGFFFQSFVGGIGRVWYSLLSEWGRELFGAQLLLLDRAYTAPAIAGIRRRVIAPLDYRDLATDRARLQRICDEEGAALFASTYYTAPTTTPSVVLVHDMIPEVLKWDLSRAMWRDKARALQQARALVAVSHHTAFDVARFLPQWRVDDIAVAHLGVGPPFAEGPDQEVARFLAAHEITRPYFVVFTARGDTYKNTNLFFKSLAALPEPARYGVVSVGREPIDPEQAKVCAELGVALKSGPLMDAELAYVYRGALALVFPSGYEGFGLPVLEAMASGCPVIACPVASIPEVLGDAGLYVAPTDVAGMAAQLLHVQRPEVRARCRERGLQRAKKLAWAHTARVVKEVLLGATR